MGVAKGIDLDESNGVGMDNEDTGIDVSVGVDMGIGAGDGIGVGESEDLGMSLCQN